MAENAFLPPATTRPLAPVADGPRPVAPANVSGIATAPNGRRITALSGRLNAAVLVRLLVSQGADIKLSSLPEDLQTALTEQIGRMRLIDRDTLAAVVSEFVETLEQVGLSFPSGIDGAMKALDGKLSSGASTKLRQLARKKPGGNPWDRILAATADELLDVLTPESAEVAAVVLSKLPVSRAADLLGQMAGERARRVAYAISLTEQIDHAMVEKIGQAIASELDNRPPPAFEAPSTARVGAILNASSGELRESVLSGLMDEDADFAAHVRKSIFPFGNIHSRIGPRDIPKILREVEQDALIRALAFTLPMTDRDEGLSAAFILENMSQRMAATLRDEIETIGRVKPKDAEVAMSAVVTAVRTLLDNGDIQLLDEDEG